jgi:hypothetical protein
VYKTQTIFHVPKGVRLLSLDDNKNAGNVAGSWYIKWDKLIYLDKDLKEVEIDGDEFEMDKKRPDEITEEDEEEDEEEDSTRKTCSRCSEESSCGNYNDDKEWVCEDCDGPDCDCCGEWLLNQGWGKMVNRGCCSDGACGHEPPIEALCGECGTWDEEDEVWRCPDCQEEHDKEHALEKKINLTVGA